MSKGKEVKIHVARYRIQEHTGAKWGFSKKKKKVFQAKKPPVPISKEILNGNSVCRSESGVGQAEAKRVNPLLQKGHPSEAALPGCLSWAPHKEKTDIKTGGDRTSLCRDLKVTEEG